MRSGSGGTLRFARTGFSLVELLVVVAIMALLTALLIPIVAAARGTARQAHCRTNLRQLRVAMMAYASDYDEMLPFPYNASLVTDWCDHGATWKQRILPYIKSRQLLVCPEEAPRDKCGPDAQIPVLGRYGAQFYWAEVHPYAFSPMLSLVQFTEPSNTFLLGENRDSDWVVEPAPGRCSDSANIPSPGYLATRHNGGSMWVFFDGHCKWLKASSSYERDCELWRVTKLQSTRF